MSDSSLSPIGASLAAFSDAASEAAASSDEESLTNEAPPDEPARRKDWNIGRLRAAWEFAATAQFCTMFQGPIEYPFESTEAFENALVTTPPPAELINLHVKMLRIMTFNRFVTPESWPHWFRKECEKRQQDWTSMFPQETEYQDLSPIEKVRILRRISEWQFDLPERFRSVAKDEDDCRHWRVDPIGWDTEGGTFWLFDDNRLYREFDPASLPQELPKAVGRGKPPLTPAKHARLLKKKPKWELVCRTISDWKTYPEKFKDSKHRYEKNLYQALTSGVGVKVIENLEERGEQELKRLQLLEEHRRQEEIQAQNLLRKRSSRLESRQVEQMEQERLQWIEQGLISADYQEEEFGRRTTRARAAAGPPVPKDAAQLRQERLKRRMQRFGEESPIPEDLIRESLESVSVDIIDDNSNEEVHDHPTNIAEFASPVKRTRIDKPEDRPRPIRGGRGGRGGRGKSKKAAAVVNSWMFSCSYGLPMISCGRCSVWQHIYCIEREAGVEDPGPEVVSKWDNQEFVCSACRRIFGVKNEDIVSAVIDGQVQNIQTQDILENPTESTDYPKLLPLPCP
ncbi:hypothetical protein BDR26DRAFT_863489 [Obelidium mucronatum]|nr:hypothetical protein BDR26DRAFT_863489 [Obelidium mucronatum]